MAAKAASHGRIGAGRAHREVETPWLVLARRQTAGFLVRGRRETKRRNRFPVGSGTLLDLVRSFLGEILNCGSSPFFAMSSTYWDSADGKQNVSDYFDAPVVRGTRPAVQFRPERGV